MKKEIQLLLWLLTIGYSQIIPVEGLHEHTPRVWVLKNCIVHVEPGQVETGSTIVLRNGIIESVGSDINIPEDATIIDLNGKHVYSGFIDSWLENESKESNISRRDHWNDKIHAGDLTYDRFKISQDNIKQLRQAGFTSAHLAPASGIFKGQSALIELSDSQDLIQPSVTQVISFEFGGWGETKYPNSLLGCIALIRQTLYDARWYKKSMKILSQYPENNELINFDKSLDALSTSLNLKTPFTFDTGTELALIRSLAISNEFNLNTWLKGSGYEYRQLDILIKSNPFVILPVNYPGKPVINNLYQEKQYTTAQLRHWDLAPDNIQKVVSAGIRIGLTSHGLTKQESFQVQLNRSIKRGLSEYDALAALTVNPAAQMGVGSYMGKIQPGYRADLVVVNGSYFNASSNIHSVWIGGNKYSINPDPQIEFKGEWVFNYGPGEGKLIIDLKDDKYSGKITYEGQEYDLKQLEFEMGNSNWVIQGDSSIFKGITRFSGWFSSHSGRGYAMLSDNSRLSWSAVKQDEILKDEKDAELNTEMKSQLAILFPEGAYGFESQPVQQSVLIDNGTLWTSSSAGILKNWDMLVVDGKIKKIAPAISVPKGDVLIIDAMGKHISAGLIDCHSHSAASSINEGTQSVTAEVRIQDVLNHNDIAIYRELAGGLTTANILHGSANAIGGQNAVIKLRWGKNPRDLIFKKAPRGIKFALGENVKQSNWGEKHTTRYPQTRMGVEQIIRDAFSSALDYNQRRKLLRKNSKLRKTTIPVRKDLELDALVEILNGERLVHCHSYRQDEILMLTRVAEDFGFNIATFQHVLEGYKIADRMAEHGAGGSTFSDWWAYKFEVYDAIPFNGALMSNVGVVVSFNSDSNELARRLNLEAAKAVKYGGLTPEDAFNFVTINPARQLQIDEWVGSLETGKDADFVIWSGPPLSTSTICEQTWIDGIRYFSLEKDQYFRERDKKIRNDLIQKLLDAPKNDSPSMTPDIDQEKESYSCSVDVENMGGKK